MNTYEVIKRYAWEQKVPYVRVKAEWTGKTMRKDGMPGREVTAIGHSTVVLNGNKYETLMDIRAVNPYFLRTTMVIPGFNNIGKGVYENEEEKCYIPAREISVAISPTPEREEVYIKAHRNVRITSAGKPVHPASTIGNSYVYYVGIKEEYVMEIRKRKYAVSPIYPMGMRAIG